MTVEAVFIPFTRYLVDDFIDEWVKLVNDSYSRAGVSVHILIWPRVESPPIKCFNFNRVQYHSTCILSWLHEVLVSKVGKYYFIGIGYIDAYVEHLNFVFGEAAPGIRVAAVYTKRLLPQFYGYEPNYNLYYERVAKEIVHEFGHLLNLSHCIDRKCVMSFSNSVNEVDLKSRFFCSKCSRSLVSYMSKTK